MPEHLVIPEILHACGVINDMEKATFLFETQSGDKFSVELKPIAGEEVSWVDAVDQSGLPMYMANVDRNFWMKYLEDTATLYWQYNTVYDTNDETTTEFAERLLEFLETHPVGRLVIDLRHNVGGNNSLNRPLIHALIRSTKTRDPGTVYAIVGRSTFSAAMMFAIDLEKHTHVIFVGEPTGSRTNHYGDSRKILLPNTGLTVRASSLYWQYSSPHDVRVAIEPTIAAELSSRDYLDGRDPALAAILKTSDTSMPASPAGTWTGRMVDYNVMVALSRDGERWLVTLEIPSIELAGLPLENVEVNVPHIRFEIPGEDGPLKVIADITGHLLVGRVESGRQQFPFALVHTVD